MHKFFFQAGFPCKSIDDMQLVELDEEDADEDLNNFEDIPGLNESQKPLDPRAGRVNVEIPQLPFNPKEISDLLAEHKFDKSSTVLSRKHINVLIDQ